MSRASAASPVQRKTRFVNLAAREQDRRDQFAREDALFDFTQPYIDERGADPVQRKVVPGLTTPEGAERRGAADLPAGGVAPIQRATGLEDAADPVHDRAVMSNVVPMQVQRRAATSAIDAPRGESVRDERTTIGAVPVAPAESTELDTSKTDSLSEDRATIDPEAEPGSLTPERARRAAARNPALVAQHGIRAADFGTGAAPDSAAFAQAVAGFQAQHGLAVDGIVGPKTAAAVRGSAGPQADDAMGSSAPADAAETDVRGAGSSLLQMKAAPGASTEDDVHRAAAAGIAGGAQPLPHLERIQHSFGAHDVSGVKAHVGGPAADATAAIGAVAYATGNHVAFAQAPDVHTAAHEAAHVVQQRGGVQLAGGVGQAGDPYEQHADAVADAVVRGDSAEALLGGNSGQTDVAPILQRKERSRDPQRPTVSTESITALVGGGRMMIDIEPIRVTAPAGRSMFTCRTVIHPGVGEPVVMAPDEKIVGPAGEIQIHLVATGVVGKTVIGFELTGADGRSQYTPSVTIEVVGARREVASGGGRTNADGQRAPTPRLMGDRIDCAPTTAGESSGPYGFTLTMPPSVNPARLRPSIQPHDNPTDVDAFVLEPRLANADAFAANGSLMFRPGHAGLHNAWLVVSGTSEGEEFEERALLSGEGLGALSDPIDIAIITEDYESWSIDSLVEHQKAQLDAALINAETSLSVFETVLAASSKNEAQERDIGVLAVGKMEEFFRKELTHLVFSAVPAGDRLARIFDLGSAIEQAGAGESDRAGKAGVSNSVKDFVVQRKQQMGAIKAALAADAVSHREAVRGKFDKLGTEHAKLIFKTDLYLSAQSLRAELNGSLSQKALFTQLARDWITSTDSTGPAAGRLEVRMDSDWRLLTAVIHSPRGDRLAEQLLKTHGGTLDLEALGVPVVVTWFPLKTGFGSFVQCDVGPDGSYRRFRDASLLVAARPQLIEQLEKNVKEKKIPPVGRLEGTKEY